MICSSLDQLLQLPSNTHLAIDGNIWIRNGYKTLCKEDECDNCECYEKGNFIEKIYCWRPESYYDIAKEMGFDPSLEDICSHCLWYIVQGMKTDIQIIQKESNI